MSGGTQPSWSIFIVEDDDRIRDDIKEYLESELDVEVATSGEFERAKVEVGLRKVDILVLDVRRDPDQPKAGIQVLEEIRSEGFVPVIFYSAIAESVRHLAGPFVRVVSKEGKGQQSLLAEINSLLKTKIPHINRELRKHVDESLKEYMWGFVSDRWQEFEGFLSTPDFARLLIIRLATRLREVGLTKVVEAIYGPTGEAEGDGQGRIHPTEMYALPPILPHLQMGDILQHDNGQFHALLWPTCDLVEEHGGRAAKVDKALVAAAHLLAEQGEYKAWVESEGKRSGDLQSLMINRRQTKGYQPQRYHYLPAAWGIPDLVVDFLELQQIPLDQLKAMKRLATLTSPYAESLLNRFQVYIGRVGTPDLNVEYVLKRLTPQKADA